MAAKKSQHFVPRLLLRRFAALEGRWQGHVFRLPIAGGAARPAVPKHEAARNRYYDLPDELVDGLQPETILEKIESGAAVALQRFERRLQPKPEDISMLAYFVALQTNRTPQDRAEARYLDAVMARHLAELRLGASDRVIEFFRRHDPSLSVEEARAEQQRILDDLRAGRIGFDSTDEREVASMFLGLNEAAEQLLSHADFLLIEIEDGPELVLPDTGYTRYDPAPVGPGSASGFLGSPTVETVVPLRPTLALVVRSGAGRLGHGIGEARYAEELNLRAFAQSQTCLYGRSQEAVVAARRLAKGRPADVIERRRRARTMWFIEGNDGPGPYRATGYSIDGEQTAWLDVDQEARKERVGIKAEDLWADEPRLTKRSVLNRLRLRR
jgi:hypothetical protein